MPDAIFAHPRLAGIYVALDPERSDLDAYVAIVEELDARSVLDVGCGTGTLALLLAEGGSTSRGSTRPVRPWRWPGPSRALTGCAGSTGT